MPRSKGDGEPVFSNGRNSYGKGDKPRPYGVNKDEFAANWERIFGKKEKKTATQETTGE